MRGACGGISCGQGQAGPGLWGALSEKRSAMSAAIGAAPPCARFIAAGPLAIDDREAVQLGQGQPRQPS